MRRWWDALQEAALIALFAASLAFACGCFAAVLLAGFFSWSVAGVLPVGVAIFVGLTVGAFWFRWAYHRDDSPPF
jgi:hypothetical protein